MCSIRSYQDQDKAALLKIMQLHTPAFFAPSELKEFEKYLNTELEDYFVIVEDGVVVGSGGINYFHEEQKARIAWDMIHPDYQGKGYGAKLIKHRIKVIQEKEKYNTIIVRTSQLVYAFYEKNGFTLDTVKKDFWEVGYDLYLMKMLLK